MSRSTTSIVLNRLDAIGPVHASQPEPHLCGLSFDVGANIGVSIIADAEQWAQLAAWFAAVAQLMADGKPVNFGWWPHDGEIASPADAIAFARLARQVECGDGDRAVV